MAAPSRRRAHSGSPERVPAPALRSSPPQALAEAAAEQQRSPASRLHVLPRDMFACYFTERYLFAFWHVPGKTRLGEMREVDSKPAGASGGLCVLPDGALCMTDIARSMIRRWEPGSYDGSGAAIVGVEQPIGMCLTGSGQLAVTSCSLATVRLFTPQGDHVRTIAEHGCDVPEFMSPGGVALDLDGHLVVAEFGDRVHLAGGRLEVFTEAGAHVRTIQSALSPRFAEVEHLAGIGAIAVHPRSGDYYVCSVGRPVGRIHVLEARRACVMPNVAFARGWHFNLAGEHTSVPLGICFDGDCNVFVRALAQARTLPSAAALTRARGHRWPTRLTRAC